MRESSACSPWKSSRIVCLMGFYNCSTVCLPIVPFLRGNFYCSYPVLIPSVYIGCVKKRKLTTLALKSLKEKNTISRPARLQHITTCPRLCFWCHYSTGLFGCFPCGGSKCILHIKRRLNQIFFCTEQLWKILGYVLLPFSFLANRWIVFPSPMWLI